MIDRYASGLSNSSFWCHCELVVLCQYQRVSLCSASAANPLPLVLGALVQC